MTRAPGHELGRALCDALGLDPERVASITLHADAEGMAAATVVYGIVGGEPQRLAHVLATYKVVPDDEA